MAKSSEISNSSIYILTQGFPKQEVYCLSSQMRRSAISIASNIAEGKNRSTKKDFRQFLFHAYGSSAELDTQIIIAEKLNLGNINERIEAHSLLVEVMKMLNKLISTLSSGSSNTTNTSNTTNNGQSKIS